MRATFLMSLAAMLVFSSMLSAQQAKTLTSSTFPDILKDYERKLDQVDQAYGELTNEGLPLRDKAGQPLGRRHIEDRRQTLVELRKTVRQLAASPQDLVLATTLLMQSEALVDDLFDLSEIAYDNDREELGKRFSDLEATMDRSRDEIESYVLSLARTKEQRLQELEKENKALQQKLRDSHRLRKMKPARR